MSTDFSDALKLHMSEIEKVHLKSRLPQIFVTSFFNSQFCNMCEGQYQVYDTKLLPCNSLPVP